MSPEDAPSGALAMQPGLLVPIIAGLLANCSIGEIE